MSKKREFVQFKTDTESWGSTYTIKEGEFKGHRLECKLVMERVSVMLDKKGLPVLDGDGLPRFHLAHHTVVRVLPPKK